MLNDQERLQHKKEVAELVIKDIELLEGDVRKGMFPAETEPEQIIELVKALASLSGGIDVVNLQKILGIHSDEMERLVNASQNLGLHEYPQWSYLVKWGWNGAGQFSDEQEKAAYIRKDFLTRTF